MSEVDCPTSREVVFASMLGLTVIQTGRSPSAMLIKECNEQNTCNCIRIAASGLLLSIFSRKFDEESLRSVSLMSHNQNLRRISTATF
jgi:hypothetical protein